MKHSPEPWKAGCNGTLESADELVVAGIDMNNAYRVEVCINACAGIPNEALQDVIDEGIVTLLNHHETYGERDPMPVWLQKYGK